MAEKRGKKSAKPVETPSPEKRDDLGRFKPGVSGNPGGRPAIASEIIALSKGDAPEAYGKVVAIMRDDKSKHQLAAALALLKLAGVFRAAEEAPTKPAPGVNPFAAATTAALLAAATPQGLPS